MICLKMATIKSNKLEYYRQHSGPSNFTILWVFCDVSGGGIPAHKRSGAEVEFDEAAGSSRYLHWNGTNKIYSQ